MKETMTKQATVFQWPSHEDSEVLSSVSEPIPSGKRQRQFRILESDLIKIETAFRLK